LAAGKSLTTRVLSVLAARNAEALLDKLNAAVGKALDDAQLRAALLTRGAEAVGCSAEEFTDRLRGRAPAQDCASSGATID
jgi:hypothetical protein